MSKHFVFVYGTLKEDTPEVPVEERRRFTNAQLQGFRMEGHTGFPGIKPGAPKDVVIGELIEYDEQEVLARLDRIEGYDPSRKNNTFYDRRLVMVRTENGDVYEAFAYIYMSDGMLPADQCERVEVSNNGDYTYYNWIGKTACW